MDPDDQPGVGGIPPVTSPLPPPAMVHVYTAADNFEAQVVGAQLGAAGILWQLRADNTNSLYPALGLVEVLVEETRLLEAAALVTPAAR